MLLKNCTCELNLRAEIFSVVVCISLEYFVPLAA